MTQIDSPDRTVTTAPVTLAPEPSLSPAARVQASATAAATQVDGVHALGSPGGRALVRALGRVPGGRPTYGSGVSVEVGPAAVAIDISLVLEYGAQAVDVADRVRDAVESSVAQETGLDVVEVNVTVVDVHHPADDVEPEPVLTPAEPVEPVVDAEPAEPVVDAEPVADAEAVSEAGPETRAEPVAEPVTDTGPDQVVVADRVVVVTTAVVEEPQTS